MLRDFAPGIQALEQQEEAMRRVLASWVCAVAVAMFVNVGPAHAGVIVSNLTETMNGHSTIYAAGPPQEYAQEFTTGSQSVELGTVVALLGDATGTFTASAELVTDNSGQPSSTVLTTFTIPTIATGATYSDETFTPNSNVMLSANTSYWFILSASGTDASAFYRWGYTDSTSYTGSGSLAMIASSNNNGATWTTHPLSYGPEILQITTASVPEPTSLILMALAAPAIVCGYRAKRKAGLAHRASR
jgi:hypothetical protein